MPGEGCATVRMFGVLHSLRVERGLPSSVEMDIPPQGVPARGIAIDLGLPLESIEAVFVNHTAFGLDHVVRPGDRVAFAPFGTPGPHRFCLGIFDAGREGRDAGG